MFELRVRDLMSSPLIKISFSSKISDAVAKMRENKISCLPVMKDDKLKGIVFYRDIVERGANLDQGVFQVMKPAQFILSTKGIIKLAQRMATSKLKALPVIEAGKVVGIVSRHDLAKLIAKSEIGIKVKSVMSKPVITISKNTSLLKARSLMLENEIRRLPVVNDKLVGIITLTDIAEEVYWTGDERRLAQPVSKIMSSPVITVSPNDSISLVAKLTVENDLSGLPVLEDDKLVGMITQFDLVKEVAKL